jgi:hypothetical protein
MPGRIDRAAGRRIRAGTPAPTPGKELEQASLSCAARTELNTIAERTNIFAGLPFGLVKNDQKALRELGARPPAATFSGRRPQRTSITMSRYPSSEPTGFPTTAISAQVAQEKLIRTSGGVGGDRPYQPHGELGGSTDFARLEGPKPKDALLPRRPAQLGGAKL